MKLRSSILIIKSDTQKQMIKFGFGRGFHDLNYFEVGVLFARGDYSLLYFAYTCVWDLFIGGGVFTLQKIS
jgi:hypothetical protein